MNDNHTIKEILFSFIIYVYSIFFFIRIKHGILDSKWTKECMDFTIIYFSSQSIRFRVGKEYPDFEHKASTHI